MSEMVERKLRKTRVGKVVSNKMDKTIVVAIEDNVMHPLYILKGGTCCDTNADKTQGC